jgi:hypothetical protein
MFEAIKYYLTEYPKLKVEKLKLQIELWNLRRKNRKGRSASN